MKSFGEMLTYCAPLFLLTGPILLMLGGVPSMIGAICLGLGLFTLAIKVDIILGHVKEKGKSE
ncbi:MAG: hypothetical protein ACYTEN_03845 [Planctomycetota bacterium]|jgi:hypothetical protein